MSSPGSPQPYDSASAGARRTIASPEQVKLDFAVAGPTSRMLAYGIDYVVIGLMEIALFLALVLAGPLAGWIGDLFQRARVDLTSGNPQAVNESSAIFMLIAFFLVLQLLIEWAYFLCIEYATGGRSLGKALVRLRVIRDDGLPITLRDCAVRNLLRAVDMLPSSYLLGLVAMVASREGKRLGDLAAGTIVVRLERGELSPPISAPDTTPSSFRFDREQLARMGPAERQLLRQTLRRGATLDPERAREAIDRTTRVLCQRIGYTPVEPREQTAFLHALLGMIERR